MYRFIVTILLLMAVVWCFAEATGMIAGTVTDDKGNGIFDATVKVSRNKINIATEKTNPDGSFLVSKLEPGTYTIIITCRGYKNFVMEKVVDEINKSTPANAVMTKLPYKASNKPDDKFAAALNAPYAKDTGKLLGKISDSSGKALAYALIRVSQKGREIAQGQCLENGVFIITDIPVGVYEVKVSLIGYKTATKDSINIQNQATTHLRETLSISKFKPTPDTPFPPKDCLPK